jgi:hypothetical protein
MLYLAVSTIVYFEAVLFSEAVTAIYQDAFRHNLQDKKMACTWKQYATPSDL